MQKSASHYTEAARDEITLLTQIRDGDPTGSRHCVRLFDWFEHKGPHGLHICMVFEVSFLPPAVPTMYGLRGVFSLPCSPHHCIREGPAHAATETAQVITKASDHSGIQAKV